MAPFIYGDYPIAWGSGFQDPASDWLICLIDLHDQIIFYLIIIATLVLWFTATSLWHGSTLSGATGHLNLLQHGNRLELIWTITPALVLWAIGIPSLRLLYLMDELIDPEITVRVVGSQWYWSYSKDDGGDPFDSFLVAAADLPSGGLRQLAVDSFIVLPVYTAIRLLVTSNDVIHSFALPSLALKVDAIPGRLNLASLFINRTGVFYGQCSELCGVLHGFMPIALHAVTLLNYPLDTKY